MGKPQESQTSQRRITICQKLKTAFARALFPDSFVCLDCERELCDKEREFSMCSACLKKLPYITTERCRICGAPIEHKFNVCKRCQTALPHFDKAYAPFAYEGFIKRMVLSYKDGDCNYLYKHIARFLTDYYKALGIACDAVCYVPSGKEKIRRRGFEHNNKVTVQFSKDTQIPLIKPLLEARSNKDQAGKRRQERLATIRGVFAPDTNFDASLTRGKCILLIDDVMTTGATANECARILKENLGAKEVIVLTLARS